MRTAIDNYLKAIFECSLSTKRTTNKQVACYLKIAPASVNGIVKKMEQHGLAYQRPYGPIMLSTKEMQRALVLMQRYRLCEAWLVHDFELPLTTIPHQAWEIADFDDAQLVQQLNQYLDYPKVSPFGGAIQNVDQIVNDGSQPLINFEAGQTVRLCSYLESENTINYFQNIGLSLQQTLTVGEYNPQKQTIAVTDRNARTLKISEKIGEYIYVSLVKNTIVVD